MQRYLLSLLITTIVGFSQVSCQNANSETVGTEGVSANPEVPDNQNSSQDSDSQDIADHIYNDSGIEHTHADGSISEEILASGCVKASTSQTQQVGLGLTKKEEFLQLCSQETNGSPWCNELVRPNPQSASKFRCTYGTSQSHVLIHPDERTWTYPITAVKIIQDLQAKGLKVSQIYNWWRPEPYNKNVGGAAGRHPYGTSIDVRFASNGEADRAFRELCKMRRQGRLRAIGHYGSSSLHIGVGDKTANTWGKSCS